MHSEILVAYMAMMSQETQSTLQYNLYLTAHGSEVKIWSSLYGHPVSGNLMLVELAVVAGRFGDVVAGVELSTLVGHDWDFVWL